MISGVNHITFAVSSLSRSIAFYQGLLGCSVKHQWAGGAYLEAGNLWLCLTLSDAVDCRRDYTHVAFSATQLEFERLKALFEAKHVKLWQANSSEGDSLYILDPDNHKLEIHVGSLQSRLEAVAASKCPKA